MRLAPTSTRAQQRWDALRARLRTARLEQGLSLTELGDAIAGRAGTRVRAGLSATERGEADPQTGSLIRHAHALGLEVALIDPRVARLSELDPDEIRLILRAARWAAQHPMPSRYQLLAALEKVAPDVAAAPVAQAGAA